MRKRSIAIGLAGLFVAACSSGGTSTPSVAVEVTPADTAAPTTASVATTTTVPPTTLAVTTTTIATEDLIKQAVQDYITAYFACGQAPAQCDPTTFTASQGPSRSTVSELATGMAAQGLYFSTDLRGLYLVAESVTQTSPTQATAVYCAYDAGVVLGPNGPDGQPTVVNDVAASVRYKFELFVEQNAWHVGEQDQIERLGEGSLCPPAA